MKDAKRELPTDTPARVPIRPRRPSEVCRARLKVRVQTLRWPDLPRSVREGSIDEQTLGLQRTSIGTRTRRTLALVRRNGFGAALDEMRRGLLRTMERLVRGRDETHSFTWSIAADGLRLQVQGHVPDAADMPQVRDALLRVIDGDKTASAFSAAIEPVVDGPDAATISAVERSESELKETVEAVKWATGAEGRRHIDNIERITLELLEDLAEARVDVDRPARFLSPLRKQLATLLSLADGVSGGGLDASMSRYDLSRDLRYVDDMLTTLHDGMERRSGPPVAPTNEVPMSVTTAEEDDRKTSTVTFEELKEPLRSRLNTAADDLDEIERMSATLADDELRSRLDAISETVRAVLSHVALHPGGAVATRTLLVVHLRSLREILESATHPSTTAIGSLDLSGLAPMVANMEASVATLLERLTRDAQEELDVRLEVWARQMREDP